MEAVYGMDDRMNREFEYYPYKNDSSGMGLGLEVEARLFQVQDYYKDILFVRFDITNKSDTDLNKMVLGIGGDPHIGGLSDYSDDYIYHERSHNLMYAYDEDGQSENPNILPGYMGIAILQTPGLSGDGIDNDDDGMVDESPSNGIDDDGDWSAQWDDLGRDGLANTGDAGEGDGQPTQGEPNFEYTDADEYDMVGLTSVAAPGFTAVEPEDDEILWSQYLNPGEFLSAPAPGDRFLLGGSGYFSLKAGETTTFGMAFLFEIDKNRLLENVRRANRLYQNRIGSLGHPYTPQIQQPAGGDRLQESLPLRWNAEDFPSQAVIEAAYSTDNGRTWQALMEDIENDGVENIDISGHPNSAFYKVRLRAMGASGYGQTISEEFFTIDHSGAENVPPEVLWQTPENQTINGDYRLEWLSGDADGDALNQQVIIQSNYLSDTLQVNGQSHLLQSTRYPNHPYRLIIRVDDGKSIREQGVNVVINNEYSRMRDSLLVHTTGLASGRVYVNIVDPAVVTGHIYKVTFNDYGEDSIAYSVMDSTLNRLIIRQESLPAFPYSGTTFDGMRLLFENNEFEMDAGRSGWNTETETNLEFNLQQLYEDTARAYPYDYQFRFSETTVDSSLAIPENGLHAVGTPFTIWNMQKKSKAMFVILESANGESEVWNSGESIYILEGGTEFENTTWQLTFEHPTDSSPVLPEESDTFTLAVKRPFSENDVYLFDTESITVLPESSSETITTFKLKQNYPNPFNPTTAISYTVAHRCKVVLDVFNILGQKVAGLVDEVQSSGKYKVVFDGSGLASGIYIYRIKAGKYNTARRMLLLR